MEMSNRSKVLIASVESVVENFDRNNWWKIFTSPAEPKSYLDEYLAEQGKLMFVDSLEKVDLIEIKSRDRMSEFRCENPDLAKQVVEQLLGFCS